MEEGGGFTLSERQAIQDLRDCLCHSRKHRKQYQWLMNTIRERVFPKAYLRNLPRTICLCKTKGDFLDKIIREDEEIHSKLKSVASHAALHAALENSESKPAVVELINEMQNLVLTNKSIRRFLFLLFLALNGRFEYMEPPKPIVEPKPKRYNPVLKCNKTITLPIRSSNVPFLVGRRGIHLRALIKNLDCKIQLIRAKEHSVDTLCKITAINPDALLNAEEMMTRKAKETESNRKLADKKTAEYHKRKSLKQIMRSATGPTAPDTAENFKENNRENFAVKYQHLQYDTGKSQARPKPPHVLEEGSRCINCLTPYTSEKRKDTKCQYHPGFIAEKEEKVPVYKYTRHSSNIEVEFAGKRSVIMSEKMWSCCGEVMSESTVDCQEQSHAKTGCSSGIHNWRLTKIDSKKSASAKASHQHGRVSTDSKGRKGIKLVSDQSLYEDEEQQEEEDEDLDVYTVPLPDVSLADYFLNKL